MRRSRYKRVMDRLLVIASELDGIRMSLEESEKDRRKLLEEVALDFLDEKGKATRKEIVARLCEGDEIPERGAYRIVTRLEIRSVIVPVGQVRGRGRPADLLSIAESFRGEAVA